MLKILDKDKFKYILTQVFNISFFNSAEISVTMPFKLFAT